VYGRGEWLWQAQLFGNPPEDALLLVRLKILDGVENRTNCFEIVFRGAHMYDSD
jgi:hypothetical protein